MTCASHDWKPTLLRRVHVDAGKNPARPVDYFRCACCKCVGFRFNEKTITYTWQQGN
jgi:hypothetical protein